MGDQKLTAANKALMNAIEDERPVYGFWQDEKKGGYEYIGRLKVEKYEHVIDKDRKVYRFDMSSDK